MVDNVHPLKLISEGQEINTAESVIINDVDGREFGIRF